MTAEPVRPARYNGRLAPAVKPTEVFAHVETIAKRCDGFELDGKGAGWLCTPWGRPEATGYGSTVFAAIADCAHQLEHQEAHR